MKQLVLLAAFVSLSVVITQDAFAVTSPYVTASTNVPLNQATTDTINGVLPYYNSHSMREGAIESLTDATSPSQPAGNVILGPDNTWVSVAWDFGDPPQDHLWRLNRFDAWIIAADNLRKGYQADLSVSVSGEVDDFSIIPNSKHWESLSQNDQYNHVRYDFPTTFIAGTNTNMDRYSVVGFRYLRLNSRGDSINNVDWQTRFVEIDAWVEPIPDPAKIPVISSIQPGAPGDVVVTWNAILGRTYAVEYKTNLPGQTDWLPAGTIEAQSPSQSFTNRPGAEPQRYYRVALQPTP